MELRQHWAPSMAAAALACIALACLPVRHALAGPKWGADYFPNIVLTTQDGARVRLYDDLLKGKAVAVNLIYTRCADVCPLETARMAEVQRLLGDRVGKDIFFYSVSIDPEHDTPAVLKAYAAKFKAGPGWLFLTGEKDDIKLLSRKLGLSRSSDPQSKDGHASSLMLGIEPAGQWMLNSAVDNARFLATTIRNFNGWPDPQPGRDYAQARPLEVSRAQYTFASRCASCHSIGEGERIGPDLLGVTQRRDRRWLARYLREPDKVLAERDPVATSLFEKYKRVPMPNLRLGDEDIAQLIGYLDAQGKARTPGAAPRRRQHEH
jgi:protein SCO1/2